MSRDLEAKIAAARVAPAELRSRIDAAKVESQRVAESQRGALDAARTAFEANPMEKLAEKLATQERVYALMVSKSERTLVDLQKESESVIRAQLEAVFHEIESQCQRGKILEKIEQLSDLEVELRQQIQPLLVEGHEWVKLLYRTRQLLDDLASETGLMPANCETLDAIQNFETRVGRAVNEKLEAGSDRSNPRADMYFRSVQRP